MTETKKDKVHDKAVEHTFPASDPPASKSATSTEPLGSDPTRKPPKITKEQVEAAAVRTEACPVCHGARVVDGASCRRCLGTGRVVSPDPDVSPINLSV